MGHIILLFKAFLSLIVTIMFLHYLVLCNFIVTTSLQVEAAVLSVTAKAKAKEQKKAAARAVSVSEEAMDTVGGEGGGSV